MILFLIGFLCSSALFTMLILAYYLRARRRVKSIQAAIEHYRQATGMVEGACNEAYGCKCKGTDRKN